LPSDRRKPISIHNTLRTGGIRATKTVSGAIGWGYIQSEAARRPVRLKKHHEGWLCRETMEIGGRNQWECALSMRFGNCLRSSRTVQVKCRSILRRWVMTGDERSRGASCSSRNSSLSSTVTIKPKSESRSISPGQMDWPCDMRMLCITVQRSRPIYLRKFWIVRQPDKLYDKMWPEIPILRWQHLFSRQSKLPAIEDQRCCIKLCLLWIWLFRDIEGVFLTRESAMAFETSLTVMAREIWICWSCWENH
jgi:hypothetical protein